MTSTRFTDRDAALELLERGLQMVQADEVELSLRGRTGNHLRYANSAVIQSLALDDAQVAVRAIRNGQTGLAFTNDLTDEGLRRAGERAAALAGAARGQGEFPGLPTPDAAGEISALVSASDAETRALSSEAMTGALEPVLRRSRAASVSLAGSSESGECTNAVVNSRGVQRHFVHSFATMSFIGTELGGASGFAGGTGRTWAELPMTEYGETAIEKAIRGKNPVSLDPGRYDVILEPEAVTELMEWMAQTAFTAKSVEQGQSFLIDKRGETLTGESVTIHDDPHCSAGVGVPTHFDAEGVATRPITFIDGGKAGDVVHDTRSARKAGCSSTGHAVVDPLTAQTFASPSHLVFNPGGASTQDLLDRVDRGLWVTRFHYVNGMMDPPNAQMTGLTRDGLFLIEKGKVTRGVGTLRFTEKILEAFQRIAGIGSELRAVPTWWSGGGFFAAPTLLIRDFEFTGRSDE